MSEGLKKRKRMEGLVNNAGRRRLINAEYQRGFMEGYHAATKKVAKCVDELLQEHDHIAVVPSDWTELYIDLQGEG